MFIPTGEIIHESLATSYVLVDALVVDLCEVGFSGVVEVGLRDTDGFIVLVSGKVSAVVEKRGEHQSPDTTIPYTRTTVEQLAERSRRERGGVSIYGYSAATASAVAGRINAQPLYVGLSTEFTDLEKMIWKLVREPDREWFIETNTDGGPGALIHVHDTECRIITSTGAANSGALDPVGNAALGKLLDEYNHSGGAFDVYYTQAGVETIDLPAEQPSPEEIPAATLSEAAIVNEEPPLASLQRAASGALQSNDLFAGSREPKRVTHPDFAELGLERDDRQGVSNDLGASAAAATQASFPRLAEAENPDLAEDLIEPQAEDFSFVLDELPPPGADVEAMAETKRLMGEIARAIEEAAQSVGRPDSFSMALRAGQLKVADRFPFLDPFAGEFEYLAGEIVFVGHAAAEEFVVGLTEALKLAVEAVTRSTAYADRFRSYVTEDLRKLLARERDEFEKLGLDQVIEELLTDDRRPMTDDG
jgi:hypothetical protein